MNQSHMYCFYYPLGHLFVISFFSTYLQSIRGQLTVDQVILVTHCQIIFKKQNPGHFIQK